MGRHNPRLADEDLAHYAGKDSGPDDKDVTSSQGRDSGPEGMGSGERDRPGVGVARQVSETRTGAPRGDC
jgi:hypothetical protein